MRLYHRDGAAHVTHDGVTYEPADDGGFDFPPAVADQLGRFPRWETGAQLQQRLAAEDLERRRDPASQFDLISALRRDLTGPDPRDAELAELRARLAALEDKPTRTRKAADENPAPVDPASADDQAQADDEPDAPSDEQPAGEQADGEGDQS